VFDQVIFKFKPRAIGFAKRDNHKIKILKKELFLGVECAKGHQNRCF
jgi:hypothetical protein